MTNGRTPKRDINVADSSSRMAMQTTNVLMSLSNVSLKNLYFLMSSNFWPMGKLLMPMYNLQISFLALNSQFVLLEDKKSILSIISITMLANQKIFSKNQTLFSYP